MLYQVNSTFYSIQGEGHMVGRPAWFIRLAGCNLNCVWCDTDHSPRFVADEVHLAGDVPADVSLVVITGGEPGMQFIPDLIQWLVAIGKTVAVETNGTRPDALERMREAGAWLTVSPKYGETPITDCIRLQPDEVKVVLFPGYDREWVERCGCMSMRRYIQPCSEDFGPAVAYVKENPEWRLSVQIQKVLRID